ncbi:hypothetical protein IA54_012940 [Xanthomonas phaseoli pv. syngonii LMG 9055]|uniref:Uncharacterized protein n=1 Tax=Xanthomonas phaseoli pv. syngonii LMG 9055 TaxID=1437878 RepID=A0A1V9GTB8_9XANT|nr:hypothetical protein IA54_012940 [Xanthomonas phaseoli pv. syngonii LMG 9055]
MTTLESIAQAQHRVDALHLDAPGSALPSIDPDYRFAGDLIKPLGSTQDKPVGQA